MDRTIKEWKRNHKSTPQQIGQLGAQLVVLGTGDGLDQAAGQEGGYVLRPGPLVRVWVQQPAAQLRQGAVVDAGHLLL